MLPASMRKEVVKYLHQGLMEVSPLGKCCSAAAASRIALAMQPVVHRPVQRFFRPPWDGAAAAKDRVPGAEAELPVGRQQLHRRPRDLGRAVQRCRAPTYDQALVRGRGGGGGGCVGFRSQRFEEGVGGQRGGRYGSPVRVACCPGAPAQPPRRRVYTLYFVLYTLYLKGAPAQPPRRRRGAGRGR